VSDSDWNCDSDYDWVEAFKCAKVDLEQVATVGRRATGQNDEADWLAFGTMLDGRTFSLRAGCDYTGWECQAGGDGAFDDPTFFTIDEQVRLERDGKAGFWPGALCRIHKDCREHTEMARECHAKRMETA
jgi:hypothetical protein